MPHVSVSHWMFVLLLALALFVPVAAAQAAPDLTADPITSNGDINRDAWTTLSFTTMVRNIGNQTAYPSPYLKNILQVQSYSTGVIDTVLGEYSKGNPSPGYYTQVCTLSACPVFETAYWLGQPGSYRARFCADMDLSGVGSVAENSEANNCGAWVNVNLSGNAQMPNLYMDNFVDYGGMYGEGPNPHVGMPVQLGSSIYNSGTANAGPMYVLFQMADSSGGSNTVDLGNVYWSDGVEQQSASWGSPWLTYTFPASAVGAKYLRACADKSSGSNSGTIPELNENDNCGTWMAVTISPEPTVSCTVSATSVSVGQSVTYTVTPANGAATPYYWTSSDGTYSNTSSSGTTLTRSFSSTGSKSMTVKGTYRSNQAMVFTTTAASCPTVTVGTAARPNLMTEDFSALPAPKVGVASTIIFNVYNRGTAAAEGNIRNLFQIANDASGTGTTDIGSALVGRMEVNEMIPASLSYTFTSAGTKYLRGCADKSSSADPGLVTESNEADNCGPWNMVNVSAAAQADLVPGSLTPTTATAGVNFTLSAPITNSGSAATGAGFTTYFAISTVSNGSGAIALGTHTMGALAAGATGTASVSISNPTAGTYYVRACTDYGGTVAESNEGNNCGAWTMVTVSAGAQPDLTASATSPTTVAAGTTTITATITNNGTASTGAGFTGLVQAAFDAGGTSFIDHGTVSMGAIAAGGSATLSYTFSAGVGNYYLRVCGDKNSAAGTGTITESNENNNCGPWTAFVVTAAGQPDLRAGTTSPNSGVSGVPVTITVPISNAGTASSGAGFTVLFQTAYDPNGNTAFDLGTANVAAVAAGGSATASFTMTPSTGTYYGRACADKSSAANAGVISESNENNNCGPWVICVIADPQPPAVSCNVSDTTVEIGESVTYTTSASSGTPTAPYTWTASDSASGLGSGSTATRSFAAAGQYDMQVKATNTANASCPRVTVAAPACAGPASLSLSASQTRVQQGSTTSITWTGSNIPAAVTSCTVSGPGVSQTVTPTASPACGISGSITTPAITTQSTYTLTCGAATQTVIVNVLPKFEYF